MARASSIDELPDEIRSEIGRLRIQGATIDELVAHLRTLHVGVSRSAVGRHVRSQRVASEKLRRSRDVATALVRELGDAPESQAARLNIELLHSAVLDLFLKGGEDEPVDAEGMAALQGNPEGIMQLSKALDHLTRSSRSDMDFRARIDAAAEKRTKTAAAEAAMVAGRARGLSAETLDEIKRGIYGVVSAP